MAKQINITVTENTHRAVPFLRVILAVKRKQLTFESAFHQLKDQGFLRKELKLTEFLDTIAVVSLTHIVMPFITADYDVELAIATAQQEQRKYLREKKYLKKKGTES